MTGSQADPQVAACPVHGLSKSYNPFVSPQLESPFPVWEEARNEAPVFFSEVLNAWVVTRYGDLDQIMRDPIAFSSEINPEQYVSSPEMQILPEVKAILEGIPEVQSTKVVVNDPPKHGQLRQYMQKTFLPKKLAAWESDFQALAHGLIDEMEMRQGGEFYRTFASQFSLDVLGVVLRLPREQMEHIRSWTEADSIFRLGNPTRDQALAGARAQRSFYELATELISERRRNPQDDFVSFAVRLNDASDNPLTEREIVGQIVVVFLAGFETTANWLTMAMALLLEGNRERWTALKNDLESVTRVVEETLRLRGSAQMNWRTPMADVEIGGVRIPAGAKVGIGNLSANRDERVFANPDVYDPDRPGLSKHMAFGKGIHTCAGAPLARQEGRIALTALAERLPDIRLNPAAGEMTYLPHSTLVMARNLHLRWDPI
jgi:cytochrome P450